MLGVSPPLDCCCHTQWHATLLTAAPAVPLPCCPCVRGAQVHDGTYTPADQFLKDPDSLCSTVTWKDEEDRVIWVYRIQVRHTGHA